jgi:putative FmdB family regulatory protein
MPLYEYQCDKCAHRFEVIQKFSDAPVDVCPKCGGPVVKLLSSPAIQFKGTGWYITDYARSGKSDSATTPASSDAKTESKTETKSEPAKTETKGTP